MQTNAPAPAAEEIKSLVMPLLLLEGPLMPMLHAVQEEYGYIPDGTVAVFADLLNLGKAEVHGVVTFYHDFRAKPTGRHVLKICRSEACQSMGGNAVSEAALAKLGLDWHETTADGALTVEPVYCLGMCACAPAAMLDGKVIGRLDGAKIDKMLQEVRA